MTAVHPLNPQRGDRDDAAPGAAPNAAPSAARSTAHNSMANAVHRLLISPQNLLVANRIQADLALSGLPADETLLGLEIACAGHDWRNILHAISLRLSTLERRDTRVAIVRGEDSSALHHAVFRAQPLEQLLRGLKFEWFHDLLARDRITAHAQPLLQYPLGQLHGYELLVRGLDDNGAPTIPPGILFEAARHLGLEAQFDARCRAAALRAAVEINRENHDPALRLRFFINFIPGAIGDARRSMGPILDQLHEGGLRPDQIVFEVVETDKIQRQRELQTLLRSYRKAGFKVALDDVGAGYSTLLSLSDLRPDYIKLDGELVRRAASGTLEAKLVRDLAETARQNDIMTIAEGIETAEHLRVALAAGIKITQGYLHARPAEKPLTQADIDAALQRIDNVCRNLSPRRKGAAA